MGGGGGGMELGVVLQTGQNSLDIRYSNGFPMICNIFPKVCKVLTFLSGKIYALHLSLRHGQNV